jgi:spore coat polysaccharide biosynthesis protein SpsF
MTRGILTLVAVRLNSFRLPRKALADLGGKPLIQQLTERVLGAKIPDRVIWCTSISKEDDPLARLAQKLDIECFRGSEKDVMSRFVEVATKYEATTIARITGDNPLTDPIMIDRMLEAHISESAEYSFTNDLPVGTRPEIMDVEMLRRCHDLLLDPDASEYMTWMVNRPRFFKTLKVDAYSRMVARPELNLTIDTQSDLEVVAEIYSAFNGSPPNLAKVIDWLDAHAEIYSKATRVRERIIERDAINYKMRSG